MILTGITRTRWSRHGMKRMVANGSLMRLSRKKNRLA